jgi:hypothetical protein
MVGYKSTREEASSLSKVATWVKKDGGDGSRTRIAGVSSSGTVLLVTPPVVEALLASPRRAYPSFNIRPFLLAQQNYCC